MHQFLDRFRRLLAPPPAAAAPSPAAQDLDLYWDPKTAAILETWGEGTVWREIEYLTANCSGPVLDVACGTGRTMELLAAYRHLEIHGCDISDFLIEKAVARGLPRERLKVCDATSTGYASDQFAYSYSIGSLEHFTEEGIDRFVTEMSRVTRAHSFHMVPVTRSGRDEGWIKTLQSYHNNSVDWWLGKFRRAYPVVHVLDSAWQDQISFGKWFLCLKEE